MQDLLGSLDPSPVAAPVAAPAPAPTPLEDRRDRMETLTVDNSIQDV